MAEESPQYKSTELSAIIEQMQKQATLIRTVERVEESLKTHMEHEEKAQRKFIETLGNINTSIAKLQSDLDNERQVAENKLLQCKASVREDLNRESRANMESLKVELITKIDDMKEVLEQRRQDDIKIFGRLDVMDKQMTALETENSNRKDHGIRISTNEKALVRVSVILGALQVIAGIIFTYMFKQVTGQ